MRSRSIAVVLLVGVAAWAVLALLGWPASLYRDNDFASLWVMGRMLLDGGDQYDYASYVAAHRAIGSRALTIVLSDTASFYPLTTALVSAPFALLPVALAAPAWLVTQVTIVAGSLIALGRRLFPSTTRRDLFLLLGLAVSAQPTWLLFGGGNVGGFILGATALSATALLAGRPVLAGVFAGALLAIKPHPLLIAMFLIVLAVPRGVAVRMVASAAAVAGAALAVTLLLRPGWIGEFVGQLGRVGAYAEHTRQSTLFGLLGPELTWLALLIAAGIVLAFILFLRRRPPLTLVIGAAVPVSLFCVPYGWSYDQIVLLVTIAVILSVISAAPPRRRVPMLVALALVVVGMSWTLYAVAFRRGDEALTALVPLAALVLLAFASRPALRTAVRA